MQVIYHPQKEQPPRQGKWVCNFIVFQPGVNDVSPTALATLLKNPTFKQYVEWGAIVLPPEAVTLEADPKVVEVIDPTKSDPELPHSEAEEALSYTDLESLRDFTTEEAEPIIALTSDLLVLERWQAAETRKGVGELLSDRIAELEPPF